LSKFYLGYNNHPLGKLSILKTKDGSISLRSAFYQETFHEDSGAKSESIIKFLNPSQIETLTTNNTINILDICFGIGYNSASIIDKLMQKGKKVTWRGLEIDKRPLNIALKNISFRKSWSVYAINFLDSLNKESKWEQNNSHGEILWGDARKKIYELPQSLKFDLILLDPFSPKKCPQLWSEEFLNKLALKMKPTGRLITYCRAAAIRSSLRRAGLELISLRVKSNSTKDWSNGTIAMHPKEKKSTIYPSEEFRALSKMEEEHLLTRAAIPYRDPKGDSQPSEIIDRRNKEQQESNLESTSNWKKRWKVL